MAIIPESNNAMVWVGGLSEDELSEYIEEFGGGLEGAPQSNFARDLGQFYDHDFLWAKAAAREVSISELAGSLGIKDDQLVQELESIVPGNSKYRCFILLWNYRNTAKLEQRFANGKLRFAGAFAYRAPYSDDF